MSDNVTFRQAPVEPEPGTMARDLPEQPKDNTQVASGESDLEPIEFRETGGRSVVLDALNINENLYSLPEEDKANLSEVKTYVEELIKAKGLSPTVGAFKKTLNELKVEMGLDEEADPAKVLDRIGGVVKAWKNLSFIKDIEEKKKIFLKLSTLSSSQDMNKEVYKLMEKYEIWQ